MKKKVAAFWLAAAMLTACGADNVTNSSEVSETQSESVSETTAESVSETESETVSETEASEETQSETVTETTTETVSETEPETEAEPEPADYRALYKEKLMSCIGKDDYFDLCDVNSDGIPELFISGTDLPFCGTRLYMVIDNELVNLKYNTDSAKSSDEFQIGAYAVVGVSDEGFFNSSTDSMVLSSYWYLKLENNKFVTVLSGIYEHGGAFVSEDYEPRCFIEDEEVTLEEFNEAVSPYESLNWKYVGMGYKLNEATVNAVLSEDYLPVENTSGQPLDLSENT